MTNQALPVQKNDKLQVTIEDLTHDGAGVAKVDGYTLFIQKALPNEVVDIQVTKTNKGYGFARLLQVVQPSTDRVEPPCEIYHLCGGCQLQHLSYEGQLAAKRKQVEDVLTRIGKFTNIHVKPTIGMENPWRYRNKSQTPIGTDHGKVVAGFYQKRSHQIINMDTCLIQHEDHDKIINKVREIATKYNIQTYNEQKHGGNLRHVVVRHGKKTNDLMVILVTKEKQLPYKREIIEQLRQACPNIKSIVQNINSKRTNVIFGEQTNILWGDEYIYDAIGDIQFAISARSFYQVNPVQTEVLYEQALKFAQLTGKETVIDAYCGIGTISLFLAQRAKKVYGVEIVEDAINDAKRNAKLNNITNVEFAVGKAEQLMPKWHSEGIRPEVIVVDPPRKGCDETLLQTMLDMQPNRIVYVSCNPATLARDLRTLVDGGYKLKDVQPVDMFPETAHVEVVALMSRL